jgi:hypothetical protein
MVMDSLLRTLRLPILGVIAGVAILGSSPSNAANHSVGGYHGGFAGRPGYGGGFRGGYYGGYRGFYGRGFYGRGYGWWGWPGGLFLASLPLYYSTWWWNGVPYYYAYDSYYVWNAPANQYEQVAPPAGLTNGGAPAPGAPSSGSSELFAYPKNGQNDEQQARDRQECRDWAASQTSGASGAVAAATPQSADSNLRAQTACLEARGYSVK